MKAPGQRGPFGRWLTRVRSERYDTQAKALRDFERLAGLRISASEYAQWESGSRVPRADNQKVLRLYEFFGSRPEDDPEEEELSEGGVVGAIDRNTAAIKAQIDVIERQARAMEALVALLAARDGVDLTAAIGGSLAPIDVQARVARLAGEREADLEAATGPAA
jgi:transcriptional regulator with XRE-family HTH domain